MNARPGETAIGFRRFWARRAWGVAWAVVGVGLAACASLRAAEEPIAMRLAIESGPVYAGQAIELQVTATAGGERPTIEPPRLDPAQARLTMLGESFDPISTTAIGDQVDERIVYRTRYRLIVWQPGPFRLGPFRARLDGMSGTATQSGATSVVSLRVLRPGFQPPPEFLGGVGPLEATAEVVPDVARVGDWVDYRIRLEGPGALGSRRLPSLHRLEAIELEPELRPMPVTLSDDPPSRLLTYRLRPRKSGSARLPPVPIGWFDARTRTFQTSLAAAVDLTVVDVPGLDPGVLAYETAADEEVLTDAPSRAPGHRLRLPGPGAWKPRWPGPVPWVVGCLGVWGLVVVGRTGLRIRARRHSAASICRRALGRLPGARSADQPALVVRALGDYTRHVLGGVGSMSGDDVADAVRAATGDALLAREAARLYAACEQALYGGVQAASGYDADATIARTAQKLLGRLVGSGRQARGR